MTRYHDNDVFVSPHPAGVMLSFDLSSAALSGV